MINSNRVLRSQRKTFFILNSMDTFNSENCAKWKIDRKKQIISRLYVFDAIEIFLKFPNL